MKQNNQRHTSPPQVSSDTGTNVVAGKDCHDKNPLTKYQKKMRERISKRIYQEVGSSFFLEILYHAASEMMLDMKPRSNGEVILRESDLFATDGSLSERGKRYVDKYVVYTFGDTYLWREDAGMADDLPRLFDKEVFEYFKSGNA